MKKGAILKLSREGLDCLSWGKENKWTTLAKLRFEYRGKSRRDKSSLTVRCIPSGRYAIYHQDFLELA